MDNLKDKPTQVNCKITVGDKVRVEKGNKPIYTIQHIIGKVVWFEETNDSCFIDECTKVSDSKNK